MKLAIVFTLLTAATVLSEDVTVETSKTAAEGARESQRKLEADRKSKKLMEESPLTIGGFLVDFSHAQKKAKLLSLRQPVDPKNDYKHLYLDERSGRPKGFVLFSLGF